MHTYTFVCFIFVYHTPPPKVPHKNMENPSVLIKTLLNNLKAKEVNLV